mgnify:CR=1 FL=1
MKRRPWTTKEIEFLKNNAGNYTDKEFGEMLNRDRNSIGVIRRRLGLPAKIKLYEVWKGHEMLASGTLEECAEQLGVSKKTVVFLGTPAYMKRVKDLDTSMIMMRVN